MFGVSVQLAIKIKFYFLKKLSDLFSHKVQITDFKNS